MTDDMTFMTTDSATIGTLLNADGTCAKHPHVRLRERDEDGNVYQRDSCPECDRELAVHRRMLKQRRAELDRQLQELEVTAEEEAQQQQQQQMDNGIPSLNGMNGGGMSSGMSMMSGLEDPHLGLLTSASFEQQFQSSVQKYVSQDDLQGLRETVAQYGASPAAAPSGSSSNANFNSSNHQQQPQQQQQQQPRGGAADYVNPYGPSLTSPSAATSGLPPMSSALYALPPMVSYPGAPPLPGSGPSSFAPTSYQQQQQQQQQQHRGSVAQGGSNNPQQQQQQQHHTLPPMEQDQGYMRTLDGLSVQMQRMQQMQDWLLMQKEQEVVLLRQRCEEQQKLLIEKEVENALLKQKLQQQEQRMQHELKLIKLAAFGRAVQRNRVDVPGGGGIPPAVVMGNAAVGPNMNNNNNFPPANNNNNNTSGLSPPLNSLQMQKEQQMHQQMQQQEQLLQQKMQVHLQQQQMQQQQQQQQQYLSSQQAAAAAAATAAAAAISYPPQQQQQQRPSTMDRQDISFDEADLDDPEEEKKDIFNSNSNARGAPSTAAAAAASSYRPETASSAAGGTTMSWTSESLKTASTSKVTPNVNNNTRDVVEDSKVAAAVTTMTMNEAASVNSGDYTDGDEESSKDLVLYKPMASAAAASNNYNNHTNSIGKSEESSSGFGDEDRDQFNAGAAPWEQDRAILTRAPAGPGVARTFQALDYYKNDVEEEEDDVELTKAAAAEEEEDDKYYGSGGVPKSFSVDQGALPEVPLEEGITMGTFATSAPQLANRFKDRFPVQDQDNDNDDDDEDEDKARELNAPPSSSDRFTPKYLPKVSTEEAEPAPAFLDDNRSLGNTVASSTYGEDRQKVVNQTLLDPYGDKGIYTGIVLRSTGMPHGLGRMKYEEDGRIYEGDWRHGRWHGYGRASFSNGDRYEGEYRFDQRHGKGIYRWNDGRVYDGNFSEDKRHGKGIFTWPDGARYDGEFVHGQREGFGVYVFCDGGKYEGSWKDGRYDGFGTCTWEDGRCYRGEWRNGMAHGRGVETYPDGRVRHDGQWINDEPIR